MRGYFIDVYERRDKIIPGSDVSLDLIVFTIYCIKKFLYPVSLFLWTEYFNFLASVVYIFNQWPVIIDVTQGCLQYKI